MNEVFIAGRRLRIGQETREVGEPVPEALFFRERIKRAMLNTGHLKEVPFDSLNDEQKEKLVIYTKGIKPIHVGGGTYELPSGKRVRGKEEAYKEMEDLGFPGDMDEESEQEEGANQDG